MHNWDPQKKGRLYGAASQEKEILDQRQFGGADILVPQALLQLLK